MRRTLMLALLAACGGPAATTEAPAPPAAEEAQAAWKSFGEPFTLEEPIAAAALLADPDPHLGQTVLVEGRISDVCQKAGCWMVLSDQEKLIRILMKDHGFSVDKDVAGATAQVEGVVRAKDIDPSEVAHFESESAEGAPLPEHAATSGRTYELVASAVRVRR